MVRPGHSAPRRQGVYWMSTMPVHSFTPFLPPGVAYIKGQMEEGENTGYRHWQLFLVFSQKTSLAGITKLLGTGRSYELSRSAAAADYVWKESTRIAGTQFELGRKPIVRSAPADWDLIRVQAKSGDLSEVPPDIYIRCYNQLRRISGDHVKPVAIDRSAIVFWGPSCTGKSHRAWSEAGMDAYSKPPTTKWWDGYQGEKNCVIDEFRGTVDISHLLRWLDKYPVRVECKGASVPLCVERFWFTSNLSPKEWYPDLDDLTFAALERRLEIVHMPLRINI